jgi:hypothetical protein
MVAENSGKNSRSGSLAVGPRDMNKTELMVRISGPRKKIFRAIQAEFDPVLLKPVEIIQRLLKTRHLPLSSRFAACGKQNRSLSPPEGIAKKRGK